jgi:2'-5' RNA ligase superfamily
MHGIVSLLDKDHYQLVEELWAELEREFSVHGIYVTPYPHFSYHVAQVYDVEKIEPVLKRITSNITTFNIRTSGLGVFTGTSPVLYIPVVRSLELTQLHQELWQEISPVSSGIQEYYHPNQWAPHITIGFGDISKENLSQIIPFLAERDFNWEITVNNLGLIYDTGIKQELKSRFDITNEPVPGESSMRRVHRRPVTRETLEQLRQFRERLMKENNGKLFEDSTEIIRQQREERTRQLLGEDEE